MALLSIVAPVFALILIGVVARRAIPLDSVALRGLRDVVFYIAIPSFLFLAIADGPSFDLLSVAGVYFAACLAIFALGLAIARHLRLPIARAAMLGLNSAYGNTVMIGIPIVGAALGVEALPPLLAIIALHSIILLPLAGILIEMGGAERRGSLGVLTGTVGAVIRNPVILAIILAFVWSAIRLPVPGPVRELLRLLGGAATPLALICLGASLPAFDPRALRAEVGTAIVLKLLALPALVWALGTWMQLPPLALKAAILTGAMPTGANAFLLAHRSEHLVETSAATVLAATVLSLVSVSAILLLIG